MTLENTVLFYASKETPDEITIDGQTLIPIRTIMRLYEPSFGDAQGRYWAEDIKYVCRKFKIPIIKPNEIYNIPCINKKFLDGILYIFRNNLYNIYSYGSLINIDREFLEDILSDVQTILMNIEQEITQHTLNGDLEELDDYNPAIWNHAF